MEIESGTHQLETLLCASIDRNFDKFEIYVLRNILCVRPVDVRNWMRLSHYEGLDLASVNCPSAYKPPSQTQVMRGEGNGERNSEFYRLLTKPWK